MIRCRWSEKVSPPRQPDLVPGRRGQRLGRDDQRVDRRHCPPEPGQPGGVALGRPDDVRRAHGARGSCGPPRLDRRAPACASWIVTPRRSTASASPRTSRPGWIAAQSGVYVAPRVPVAAQPLGRPGGVEQRRSSSPGPSRGRPRPRAGPGPLRPVAGQHDRAALGEVASMPSAAHTRADLVDRGAHRGVLGERRLAAGSRASASSDAGTAPSTSRRCARRRRSRRPPSRARRCAGSGRPRRGSRPSTGR